MQPPLRLLRRTEGDRGEAVFASPRRLCATFDARKWLSSCDAVLLLKKSNRTFMLQGYSLSQPQAAASSLEREPFGVPNSSLSLSKNSSTENPQASQGLRVHNMHDEGKEQRLPFIIPAEGAINPPTGTRAVCRRRPQWRWPARPRLRAAGRKGAAPGCGACGGSSR